MEKAAYKAEDVPAYMFDTKAEKPWRDEDIAMSGPVTVAKDTTFVGALDAIQERLTRIASMDHNSGEQGMYLLAAAFFGAAKLRRYPAEIGVQISGRVYRVREQ